MGQIIISVGREFGSGGRVIAEALAERFNIPIYDRHLITDIAEKTGLTPEEIEKYNENPKHRIWSRSVRGYSNSIEDNIAEMQFKIIDDKAKSGESFVVVGRCSETKLRKYDGLCSLFILADMDAKIKRVMELYELDRRAQRSSSPRRTRRESAIITTTAQVHGAIQDSTISLSTAHASESRELSTFLKNTSEQEWKRTLKNRLRRSESHENTS